MAQELLDTRGYMSNIECQITFAAPCIISIKAHFQAEICEVAHKFEFRASGCIKKIILLHKYQQLLGHCASNRSFRLGSVWSDRPTVSPRGSAVPETIASSCPERNGGHCSGGDSHHHQREII